LQDERAARTGKRKKTPQKSNRDTVSVVDYNSLNAMLLEELRAGNETHKLESVSNEIKPPEIIPIDTP